MAPAVAGIPPITNTNETMKNLAITPGFNANV